MGGGIKINKILLETSSCECKIDFYSLLTQIEATLNSRPLTSKSIDPNDLLPLTPAHFLIDRPYTAVADSDLRDVPESRLSKWQHVQ